MHESREDEGSNVIGEVTDHTQNIIELRDEPGDQGHANNFKNTEDDVDRVGNETLALGARTPVAFDDLVGRLHPQGETADDGDSHQKLGRNHYPGTFRKRVQDVFLHTNALVKTSDGNTDNGVNHSHQADGDTGRLDDVVLAVSAQVFL